ncbi:hypothetical protein BDW02DRAFT_572599 [Decorospora gaudefroyi]|uniref:BTB domain-containing protein n=1 Tax=Decorospora gaudefroyi TaxID=184978 RepID=A0A6A5K252_9PLEO|nr:hypothetical protein BDW02DRAFT_572599 [Decorospora gaudefroyi]
MLAGVYKIKITEKRASQTFVISTALLQEHAPKLSKHIVHLQEQNPNNVELDHASIATFAAFIDWLNDQEDNTIVVGPPNKPLHRPGLFEDWTAIVPLIKLYAFADHDSIPQLRSDVLYRLSCCIRHPLSPPDQPKALPLLLLDRINFSEAVEYAYTTGSPAVQRVMVDLFCALDLARATDTWEEFLEELPRKFLVDVLLKERGMLMYETCRTEATAALEGWQAGDGEAGRKRRELEGKRVDVVVKVRDDWRLDEQED